MSANEDKIIELALVHKNLLAENERLKSDNKLLNGCIEDCEDSIKEFERLESENEKLKACVEFYADECWVPRAKDFSDWCSSSDLDLIVQASGMNYEKGGKLARKTLSELKPSKAMEIK